MTLLIDRLREAAERDPGGTCAAGVTNAEAWAASGAVASWSSWSQLSRGVEQRPDKRPMLSDLKEAGGIEADADIITFLYRDDYYNADSDKKGIVELIIAKGRDIGTGKIEMAFLKQFGKFADIDHSHRKKAG